MNYNNRLLQLHQKICCKNSLEAKLSELEEQLDEAEDRTEKLKKILKSEQSDVDRLEKISLASVFYSITGKKDEVLSKEKAEAYAAGLKYDSAVQFLNSVREDIDRTELQLQEIHGCEKEYEELLASKIEAIKASGSAEAQQIFNLDRQISQLKNQKREIEEAIAAGSSALHTADSVLESLSSAENWGTLDLFGGNLLSDVVKHSHLDDAQAKIYQLQDKLRKFKTELADVKIQLDTQVSIEGFLKFADYFFDNIFTDMAVMDKIQQSQSNVQGTKSQLEALLNRLNTMAQDTDSQIFKLEEEKNNTVASAAL